jgi:prepilin-type N-terminal cleavage/methylation domain-containing protein
MVKRAAIISVIVFVILLALPIALGFFYGSLDQNLTNQVIAQQQTVTDLTANGVKIKLDNLVSLAASIAAVPTLSAQMAMGNWNGAATVASDLENNPTYYDPYIDRIAIYDPQGIQRSAYPELVGAIGTRGASDAWYQPLVDGAPFYVDHVIERLSAPRIKVFDIVVPVKYQETSVGFLALQIPIEDFLGFSVNDLANPYIVTYIVDSQGNLVSDPDGSNPNGAPVNFSTVPAVSNALAGESGVMTLADGAIQIPSLISYTSIPGYNWGVVTESPTATAFANRDSILSWIMFGILATISLDLVIAYAVWKFFMRPSKNARRPAMISAKRRRRRSGFTLIELLVVIAIIAILSIVIILTINPAELLRQSRDSNRISDLGTLKTALSLYLADTSSPNLASSSAGYGSCYISAVGSNATTSAKCGVFTANYTSDVTSSASNYRNVNSTGWLPVNFSQLSYGSPFGTLPVDPVNSLSYYYAYAATSTGYTFEIDAFMESKKYGAGGSNDVVTTDGGDNTSTFEVGSKLTL